MSEDKLTLSIEVKNMTGDALKAHIRDLTKLRDTQVVTSAEYDKYNKQLVLTRQYQDELRGGTGALMKDYFEFGTAIRAATIEQGGLSKFIAGQRVENRLQNFILRESKDSVIALSNGFAMLGGTMVGTSTTVKALSGSMSGAINTFTALDFAAKGLQTALGITGAAFGTMSMVVAGLAALGTAVGAFFNEISKEAEESAKQIRILDTSILELRKSIGLITSGEYMAKLIKQHEDLRANVILSKQIHVDWMATVISLFKPFGAGLKLTSADLKAVREAEQAALEGEKKLFDETKGIQEENVKGIEQFMKMLDQQRNIEAEYEQGRHEAWVKQKKDIDEAIITMQKFFRAQKAEEDKNQRAAERRAPRGPVSGVAVSPLPADQQMKKLGQEGEQLGSVLVNSFARVGDSISKNIIGLLGEANSLFEIFVQSVLQGLIDIAVQLASMAIVRGIFGTVGAAAPVAAIPFASGGTLYEPVVGMGQRSGSLYTFAERGPERFSPATSFGSSGQSQVIEIHGTFKSSGRDLISTFNEARIIHAKTGGRII